MTFSDPYRTIIVEPVVEPIKSPRRKKVAPERPPVKRPAKAPAPTRRQGRADEGAAPVAHDRGPGRSDGAGERAPVRCSKLAALSGRRLRLRFAGSMSPVAGRDGRQPGHGANWASRRADTRRPTDDPHAGSTLSTRGTRITAITFSDRHQPSRSPSSAWSSPRVSARDFDCIRCGRRRVRRPISNYFNPEDGKWWHVPYFAAVDRRCSDCRAR